jgi:hypothetical protein
MNQMSVFATDPSFYHNHYLFSTLRPRLESEGLDHMAHYYFYMDPLIARFTVIIALQYFRYDPTDELFRRIILVRHFDSFLTMIGTRYPYPFLSLTWMTQLSSHTLVASYKFQLMLNRLTGEDV